MDKKELAHIVGAYDGTYSSWENSSVPGVNWLPRLAKALGVSADYLLGLTDTPDPYAIPEGWQPLDEDHLPKRGDLVLMGYESAGAGPQYAAFFYRGGDLFEPAGPDGKEIDGFGYYEFWCRVERYEPKGDADHDR
ncbi:MAG: helix-turn-helix transcriptional regulator [Pseudoflavonifractor sp.]